MSDVGRLRPKGTPRPHGARLDPIGGTRTPSGNSRAAEDQTAAADDLSGDVRGVQHGGRTTVRLHEGLEVEALPGDVAAVGAEPVVRTMRWTGS